jgi:ribosome-binding protein aMBF1 (putative translation factor)
MGECERCKQNTKPDEFHDVVIKGKKTQVCVDCKVAIDRSASRKRSSKRSSKRSKSKAGGKKRTIARRRRRTQRGG